MEGLIGFLKEEEEAFTKNMEAFRDVYVSMIENETVVPADVQQALWPGFSNFLNGQLEFMKKFGEINPDNVESLYKEKIALFETGFSNYVGNLTRAVGVLLDLRSNNKTWKVYMEGAIMDSKAKNRDFFTFLVMPRTHLRKLMTLFSPFEECAGILRSFEGLEKKLRNVAGRTAAEDAKGKNGIPGLNKLKLGSNQDFLDNPTRRLLRDGKVLTQNVGLGKAANKKKAKEVGYYLCSDCIFWAANVKGPVKGCVRLLKSQIRYEALDEGGYALELTDPGTNMGIAILCNDETTKKMWEQDFNDWIEYWMEVEKRNKRDAAERIKFEAEERAKQEQDRIRQMEIQREAIEAEKKEKAARKEEERQKELASRPAEPTFGPGGSPRSIPSSPRGMSPGVSSVPSSAVPPPSLSSPRSNSPRSVVPVGGTTGGSPLASTNAIPSPSVVAPPVSSNLPPPVPSPGRSPAVREVQLPPPPSAAVGANVNSHNVRNSGGEKQKSPRTNSTPPPIGLPAINTQQANNSRQISQSASVIPQMGGAPNAGARTSPPPSPGPRPSAAPRVSPRLSNNVGNSPQFNRTTPAATGSPAAMRGNSKELSPRVPMQRSEAPPPWQQQQQQQQQQPPKSPKGVVPPQAAQRSSLNGIAPSRVPVGPRKELVAPQYPKEQSSSGPRLPQKRAAVKPPWEK